MYKKYEFLKLLVSFFRFVATNRQNETNNFKISYFLNIFYDNKIIEVNKQQNKNLRQIRIIYNLTARQGSFENKAKAVKKFIRKRRRSIIDIGYGSYINSFTGEQKHTKK
jgi:hypothetical protein